MHLVKRTIHVHKLLSRAGCILDSSPAPKFYKSRAAPSRDGLRRV
ncbi:hypothetical protein DSUL_20518 [Desulfovibrionales bacterium]